MLLFYNFVLAFADVIALRILWRTPSLTRWLLVLGGYIVFSVGLAVGVVWLGLGEGRIDMFYVARLMSAAIFLHGTLGLVASAWVFRSTRRWLARGFVVLAVLMCLMAFDMWVVEPTWPEVSSVEITSSKLSRPLRVVVIADLQTADFGDYERGVLHLAFAQKPDLVLWAGDYIQTYQPEEQVQAINAFLRENDYRAPLGSYAVRGNVDPPEWARIFADTSIEPIERTQTFTLNGMQLTCLSLHDSFNSRLQVSPSAEGDEEARSPFHIVLGHVPNFAMGEIDADLLLAGHTHGGQVQLPLVGPLIANCRVPRSWAAGSTTVPSGGRLIVSRGIGMERGHAPQIRFLCRPEVLVIDLKPESP